MSTYRYRPLNVETGEIRLLELHRGVFDDPIKISIYHTPFDIPQSRPIEEDRLERIQETLPPGWTIYENLEGRLVFFDVNDGRSYWEHPHPERITIDYKTHERPIALCEPAFEALSYVWGGDRPSKIIRVVLPSQKVTTSGFANGENEAPVVVRQNLYDALKHLRKHDSSRFLWIDAISINQEDLKERNQQVRRMGDIYKFAQRVVVWLGLACPGSDSAMRLLGHIGDQVEVSRDNHSVPAPDCVEHGWYQVRHASKIEKDPLTWWAVYDLLCRPWFHRLWIIQEIMLANHCAIMQCSNDAVTWRQMRTALRFCWDKSFPDGSPSHLRTVIEHRAVLAYPVEGQDPFQVFSNALRAQCSDSRDKIIATLGLLPPAFSQRIKTRYDRPALDVYRETFQAHVECTGGLTMLNLAGPSWIPNLSLTIGFLSHRGVYSSGASSAEVTYASSGDLLAPGMLYDSVERAAGPLPDDTTEIVKAARNTWLKDSSADSKYPTGISLAEGCVWTLYRGQLEERWPKYRFISITKAMLPFLELDTDYTFPEASDLETIPHNLIRGGSIFRTAKGYFGFTYRAIQPGDTISLLLGCSWPVILRKHDSHRFDFVGSACVHGLMDGEAMLGLLPKGYQVAVNSDHNGDFVQTFVNTALGIRSTKDPRLEPLPRDWESTVTKDRLWGTKKVDAFRNKDTGEIMYTDPRLLPDALRAHGIPLQQITLCHQDTDQTLPKY